MDEDSSADAFFDDLLGAVEQQLEASGTAYVRRCLDKLTARGEDDAEAREQIAACLAEECDIMLRSGRPFDEAAYRERLKQL